MGLTKFKATDADKKKIVGAVAGVVSKVMTDSKYVYTGDNAVLKKKLIDGKQPVSALSNEELQMLLQEETETVLKQYKGENGGLVKFNLTDEHIASITTTIPGYVDKKHEFLISLNKLVLTAPDIKLPVIAEAAQLPDKPVLPTDKIPPLKESLSDGFQKKLEPVLIQQLGDNETTKTFIAEAKEKFAAAAAEVISGDPSLLKKGQEGTLSATVIKKLMEDKTFTAKAIKIANTPENEVKTLLLLAFQSELFGDAAIQGKLVEAVGGQGVINTVAAVPKSETAPGSKIGGDIGAKTDSIPAVTAEDLIKLAESMTSASLKKGLADGTAAGTMFNEITGLDKDPNAKTNKPVLLGQIANEITNSGVLYTDKNPTGIFEMQGIVLKFHDPEMAQNPAQAFKDTKERIVASLEKKDLGINSPDKALLLDAIAEGATVGMVNQALPADKQLNPKAPEFTKAQVALAQKTIAGQIKSGLEHPTARSLLSLSMTIDDTQIEVIAQKASESLALLIVNEENPPTVAAVTQALDEKLKNDIPNKDARNLVASNIATGFVAKMTDKPVAAAQPNTSDMEAVAKAMAKQKAKDGIQEFKSLVKDYANSGRLAPAKVPTGFGKWVATKLKPAADWAMDKKDAFIPPAQMNAAVDAIAVTIDQDKLANTISSAVIEAASDKKTYYNSKKFHELDDTQKKKVVTDTVREAVKKDFDSIFPGTISVLGFKVEIPFIKNKISDKIASETGNSMRFSSPEKPTPAVELASLSNLAPMVTSGMNAVSSAAVAP